MSDERCVCGHTKAQHIYHEGACRAGFPCPHGCKEFTPIAPVAPVERGEPEESADDIARRLCVYAVDMAGGLDAQSEMMQDILRDIGRWVQQDRALRAAPNEGEARSIFCVWCGAYVEYHGKPGEEIAAKSAVREHSATCPEHPAVKELAALRAAPRTDG